MTLRAYGEWHKGLSEAEKERVRGHLFVGAYEVVMVRVAVHSEPWRKDVARKTRAYDIAMKRRSPKK